jgi:hypothetical protein
MLKKNIKKPHINSKYAVKSYVFYVSMWFIFSLINFFTSIQNQQRQF